MTPLKNYYRNEAKKILYLTYDGLSDHIGQSQILPYLLACNKRGVRFDILSFEKKANKEKIDKIGHQLKEQGIKWNIITFTSGGNISKFYDVLKFASSVFFICIRNNYAVIHCRSYTSSIIGLSMKFLLGKKLIFDKRDFWIDAKIETGRLNLSRFHHRMVSSFLRFFEKQLFLRADHIVSLTERAKEVILQKFASRKPEDITVIPCCVDLALFDPRRVEAADVACTKASLGLNGSFILGYVGSIGSAYLVPELLDCFKTIRDTIPDAKLLFLVNNGQEEVYKMATKQNISRNDIVVTSSPRSSMPTYISLFDMGIFFITPSYAKQATSPTKLFEMLAMNKFVISNKGVGDAEKIFSHLHCGYLVNKFEVAEYQIIADWIKQNRQLKSNFDLSRYSLEYGASRYFEVYRKFL